VDVFPKTKEKSKSELLYEKAKKLMPGGVSSPVRAFAPYPFFTSRAKGSRIVDVDGNEYIDYCLAYGPLILGHSHAKVVTEVRKQLDKGTMYGTPTEKELKLAELICESVPCAEMIRLVNTGTEATMSAIRAARGYTGRKKIVKFEGCYHGAHDCVLVKAGSGATTFGTPDSLGVPEETTQNTLVLPYNDIESFEQTVKRERDHLAAVIIEPVVGNAGVILPKDGYLKRMDELTEENEIVLIFDETITGFRLSFGGAQEYFGVVPDMVTLGKIMGGGFPIAAYAGRKEIMETVAPAGRVYQAGTFSGNPISVVAGLATLEYIKSKGHAFYERLESKTNALVETFRDFARDKSHPFQISHIASMFQIFFAPSSVYDYRSAKAADLARFKTYHTKLLEKGVYIPPSQFETCFVSESHTREDIHKTKEAIALSLR
jgi:glutamate-1-semialdehyde 2,1-aminomutase